MTSKPLSRHIYITADHIEGWMHKGSICFFIQYHLQTFNFPPELEWNKMTMSWFWITVYYTKLTSTTFHKYLKRKFIEKFAAFIHILQSNSSTLHCYMNQIVKFCKKEREVWIKGFCVHPWSKWTCLYIYFCTTYFYSMDTLTWYSWINYLDCYILN